MTKSTQLVPRKQKGSGLTAPGKWAGWNFDDPLSIQVGESFLAHRCLLDFYEMGPRATCRGLAQRYRDEATAKGSKVQATESTLVSWAEDYQWRHRVARYTQIQFQIIEAERREMVLGAERQREEIAGEMLKVARGMVDWLQSALEIAKHDPRLLGKVRPSEVAAVVRVAMDVSHLEHGSTDGAPPQHQVSDDEVRKVAAILRASFGHLDSMSVTEVDDNTVDGEVTEG